MAAGLGFKTFTTGEVLTAGDVNGYLMQGVLVFASEAARNAAITSPQEGQFAYTKDNNSLWYYTGSAWAASGATGDIEGVTVTSPLTGGGTSGTVTVGILSGTTSNLGAVQLSDSVSSTSTTLAATANAVKTTYDLAAAKGGMTSIATGSLSGSSVSITSIAGTYTNLQLAVYNFKPAVADQQLCVQLNGVTAASYAGFRARSSASTIGNYGGSNTNISLDEGQTNSGTSNAMHAVTFYNYADTLSFKAFSWSSQTTGTSLDYAVSGSAQCRTTSAITNMQLFPSSGNFTSGTYVLWGVK